jgi:pimeloyl-ACP methyl ester carboxylesterase
MSGPPVSRRRVLKWGLGGAGALVVAGVGGMELVLHDVLPGHGALGRFAGACDVKAATPSFAAGSTSTSGQFFSRARNRQVGYSLAYPPGHIPGQPLALIVVLHGLGRDHTNPLSGLSLAQAAAVQIDGRPPAPVALVAADGGSGYWHAHVGDDPLGMVVDQLIPMCQALGLGRPPERIGALGISMGGFGALLLAQRHPALVDAVAAISPAVWRSYPEARAASSGAFASAADFAANDVITHASELGSIPVWVAVGRADPFHGGVSALAPALPAGANVRIAPGCHDDQFWQSEQPAAFGFLGDHLSSLPVPVSGEVVRP